LGNKAQCAVVLLAELVRALEMLDRRFISAKLKECPAKVEPRVGRVRV